MFDGIERFIDREELDQFVARVAFAAEHASIQPLEVQNAFRELCRGLKSFAELKTAGASLIPTLEQRVGAKLLNDIAPCRIRLPGGRQTKVVGSCAACDLQPGEGRESAVAIHVKKYPGFRNLDIAERNA